MPYKFAKDIPHKLNAKIEIINKTRKFIEEMEELICKRADSILSSRARTISLYSNKEKPRPKSCVLIIITYMILGHTWRSVHSGFKSNTLIHTTL